MPRETISVTHLTSLTQLNNQINWKEFSISTPCGKPLSCDNFKLVAIGYPNQIKERLDVNVIDDEYNTRKDLIYALVINEKILKVGKSIKTMKGRIASYHCGKNAYRNKPNSTNSATNWFVLQSALSLNLPVYIYVLYIPATTGEFMGWTFQNRVSKEVEALVIEAIKNKYGFKPIGNKQN